ncbi:hypothetical protein CL629_04115 [bacterium]|nr:hypothetical protein [bacterium]
MEKKEIIQQLEKLKSIEPHWEFQDSSKRSILASSQSFSLLSLWRPLYMGSFAALALVIGLSIILISGGGSSAYASLDMGDIKDELEELTISIELEEIAYSESLNEAVAVALQEISNDSLRHLNTELLLTEQEKFLFEEEGNPEIDELLNTVLF